MKYLFTTKGGEIFDHIVDKVYNSSLSGLVVTLTKIVWASGGYLGRKKTQDSLQQNKEDDTKCLNCGEEKDKESEHNFCSHCGTATMAPVPDHLGYKPESAFTTFMNDRREKYKQDNPDMSMF